MNTAQSIAFGEGTGDFFTASEMLFSIQAIGSTLVFLYIAWLCLRAYVDYGDEYLRTKDLIILWFRAVFVLMVLLYLLVN